MWTRTELKTNAKSQMKGRYWNYLGASLMPQLASYVISIPISIISQVVMTTSMAAAGILTDNSALIEELNRLSTSSEFDINAFVNIMIRMLSFAVVPTVILTLISLAASVLIMYPIVVGMNRWFIRSREERNISLSICFSVYKKDSYLKVTGSMFYMMFFNFLWYMLFWIPGIVKSYSYRMVPYILADNPTIGAKRALKLSCEMTKGSKFDMFILDLSFIGWYLLGFLACCIGVVAVVPYALATFAELYDSLKKTAVENGICTMEDLGYVKVSTQEIV